MQGLTKKRRTRVAKRQSVVKSGMRTAERRCTLTVSGPEGQAEAARAVLSELGFHTVSRQPEPETLPWREAFPQWTDAALPGVALAGARYKEGLTQAALAQA